MRYDGLPHFDLKDVRNEVGKAVALERMHREGSRLKERFRCHDDAATHTSWVGHDNPAFLQGHAVGYQIRRMFAALPTRALAPGTF